MALDLVSAAVSGAPNDSREFNGCTDEINPEKHGIRVVGEIADVKNSERSKHVGESTSKIGEKQQSQLFIVREAPHDQFSFRQRNCRPFLSYIYFKNNTILGRLYSVV